MITDEELDKEGAEEAIEDLEAPADAQTDIAGGQGCGKPSVQCLFDTCAVTEAVCGRKTATHQIVVYEE
jgi:hypothetical protein